LTTAAETLELPPPEPGSKALGRHTAHGFAWMVLQTLLTKGVAILGTAVTGWYLTQHDFALVGLSYSVASFPNLIRDAGLQQILVQRQKHLRRWIGPVFWMSTTLGLTASIGMCIAAPFAARLYKEPAMLPLIEIVAMGTMLSSLTAVPQAIAQIQLRFRLQASLALTGAMIIQGVGMLLAWKGYGPYSYIVPNVMNNLVICAAFWILTPAPVGWRPRIRRWRYVIGDSGTLILSGLVVVAIMQGPNLLLGFFHRNDHTTVGLFYFAFNLSWQALVLLTFNLGAVLFPALSKLHAEPLRQVQAYLRAARLLALVGVPVCFLQAAVAAPGFHMLWRHKWDSAIPVVQVLSLAMAMHVVGVTWMSLNSAQGRFRRELAVNSAMGVLLLSGVAIASYFGGALAVAATETVIFLIVDPVAIYLALRNKTGLNEAAEVVRIFAVPFPAGALAVGIGWGVGLLIPPFHGADPVRILAIMLVTAAVYIPLVRWLAPGEWKELMALRRRSAAK